MVRATEPSGPPALAVANAALRNGHYDLAVTEYSEYLKAHPKDAAVFNDRGLAYKFQRDYEHAIADFNESLRLRPQAYVYLNRGTTFAEMGEDDKAVADYSKAIELAPRNPTFLVQRAHAYFNKENNDAALADLNKAITIGVKEADAFVLRGIIYKALHHYEQSLADYEKAISLEPNNPRCYDVAAHLFSVCPAPKYRNGKRALIYATKACDLSNWRDAWSIKTLAEACAENGQFEEAVNWQRKAGELDPNALDPLRIDLYQQKKPVRELNRKEPAVPTTADIKNKFAIKLGDKFSVAFEEDGGVLKNPKVSDAGTEQLGIEVEYRREKENWILITKNRFNRALRARCLARLKDYDTYFETDILPVPARLLSLESWQEPIDELVLFDFKLTDEKQP
jgi:tetratricopeptide (TPR) repeat protein